MQWKVTQTTGKEAWKTVGKAMFIRQVPPGYYGAWLQETKVEGGSTEDEPIPR